MNRNRLTAFGLGMACAWGLVTQAEVVSLAGRWRIALDPRGQGETERWFAAPLPGALTLSLPGTTDQAGLGDPLDQATMAYPVEPLRVTWPGVENTPRLDQAGYLLADHAYIGEAWYQCQLDVPPSWEGHFARLRLERVLWESSVWMDDRPLGKCDSLVTPHAYDLGVLTPGAHRLTVRVDNRPIHNLGVIGHAYGPETQSRWNGLVGALELIVTDPVYVRRMRITPAADGRSVQVRAFAHNASGQPVAGMLRLVLRREKGRTVSAAAEVAVRLAAGEQVLDHTVPVKQPVETWDEFHPTRYQLVASLETKVGDRTYRHELADHFGFRQVRRDGRHILVNDRRIFLRGTLDCCVYPRTGHPPTDLNEWLRVLGTIREYGCNHVRYHSWCPPAAAFEAADQLGLYLAPETPFWVDDWTVQNTPTHPPPLGRDPQVLAYVRREVQRISEAYGNHPSFAFFCLGNEFGNAGTDWDQVNGLLAEAKREDGRRLYTATTARRHVAADDYWATHHTGKADTRGVGPPRTDWDFATAAQSSEVPLVGHETGQRPVFPDYDRFLAKFVGPLKPYNYQRLRAQADQAGVLDQMRAFQAASARFQLIQYKAEHEAMLRTADYAGYQWLMLNDFTGQSEALVGVLDPFWESKGVVTAAEVLQWNGPLVPLARFARYTWRTDQTFEAIVDLANYTASDLVRAVARWNLRLRDGSVLAQGQFGPLPVPTGRLNRLGSLQAPLEGVSRASALVLGLEVAGATNEWPLWVYPTADPEPASNSVLIAHAFDEATRRALADGKSVLLLANGLKNDHTARTGFYSTYWSAGWWGNRFSSLGVMCEARHPAWQEFPNDGHSDWQWFELTDGATTFDLAAAPAGFRPLVQPVTDFHHTRLLAQVFEARVGRGRLLVTGYDLENRLDQRLAARQMRRSLLQYMDSPSFQPPFELEPFLLARWLTPAPP